MPSIRWIGKNDIKNHHNTIEYRVIDCIKNIGEPNSGNMVVKGDNLEALKSLLPYYAGKVKLVYIDPPYNTGNTTWVYNDAVNSPVIKRWLEKTIDSNDLSRSDKWLCMIYPRIKLLHEFLREDGAIFVSIDDAEVANLRKIMDEIFGQNNFVANIIWEKKYSPQNDAKWFSDNHDHILIYAKNKDEWYPNLLERSDEQNSRYKNPDNDPRGDWKSGDFLVKTYSESYVYPITLPSGREIYPPEGKCWRTSKVNFAKLVVDNRIWFGEDGDNVPAMKRFLSEVRNGIVPLTIWKYQDVGHNQEAQNELKQIFQNATIFQTPKPVRLLKRIIALATDPYEEHIIMDSFAGSGTTAHAVLQKNKEDNGNRKFILIELEDFADEITAERVKRVIQGYKFTGKHKTSLIEPIKLTVSNVLNLKFMSKFTSEVNQIIEQNKDDFDKIEKTFKDNTLSLDGVKNIKETMPGIGGGFQYCELSEPLFDELGLLSETVTYKMLAKHIYFTEFGTANFDENINEEKSFAGKYRKTGLYLFLDKKFKREELNNLLLNHFDNYIVYADSTTLTKEQLNDSGIVFKKLPFDIKDK